MKSIARLIISIVVCQLAGVIGSVFTAPSITAWYSGLNKPFFTPPNWLFAPVWITLYLLMGIALFLIWNKGLGRKNVKASINMFAIQLALNIVWSLIFFGIRMPLYAFIEIILLWIAIAATILLFWRIDRRAGAILVPYIVWVTIASALNLFIWILN